VVSGMLKFCEFESWAVVSLGADREIHMHGLRENLANEPGAGRHLSNLIWTGLQSPFNKLPRQAGAGRAGTAGFDLVKGLICLGPARLPPVVFGL
jgi:hypothetical protein